MGFIDPVADAGVSMQLIDCVQADGATQRAFVADDEGQAGMVFELRRASNEEVTCILNRIFRNNPGQPLAQARTIAIYDSEEFRGIFDAGWA
jgi:hypothetical protein